MSIILFEDSLVPQLYPVTVGRPAFSISCGGASLIEQARLIDTELHCVARPHLWDLLRHDYPDTARPLPNPQANWLFLNARAAPSVATRGNVSRLLKSGQPGVIMQDQHIAAAVVPASPSRPPLDLEHSMPEDYLSRLSLPSIPVELPLLEFPHDIVRYHMETLNANLEDRIARGVYRQLQDGLFVAEGAQLGQHVVVDTSSGPVVVEEGAKIGPFCYLNGPVLVGRNARLLEHAALKDGVAIGHTTKVGGEVEASVIEPYTNKQHHGFLGHSYLGSWINLGAGTCNSDLKNTYGEVKMEYQNRKVGTRMQFFGCVIGDYSKTAINTSVFTGKTIGVCSMVYGFVTTNVPSFVNYARSFGQVTELPVEVMVATQGRMFARRNVPQRTCDMQLIQAMYALTGRERQLAGEPLQL